MKIQIYNFDKKVTYVVTNLNKCFKMQRKLTEAVKRILLLQCIMQGYIPNRSYSLVIVHSA